MTFIYRLGLIPVTPVLFVIDRIFPFQCQFSRKLAREIILAFVWTFVVTFVSETEQRYVYKKYELL